MHLPLGHLIYTSQPTVYEDDSDDAHEDESDAHEPRQHAAAAAGGFAQQLTSILQVGLDRTHARHDDDDDEDRLPEYGFLLKRDMQLFEADASSALSNEYSAVNDNDDEIASDDDGSDGSHDPRRNHFSVST